MYKQAVSIMMTNMDNCLSQENMDNKLEKKRIRDDAMNIIHNMSPREFQKKLLDDTLPDFHITEEYDNDYPLGITRDTCHPHCLLTEDDFNNNIQNYAYVHRDILRYITKRDFIALAYYDEYPTELHHQLFNSSLPLPSMKATK